MSKTRTQLRSAVRHKLREVQRYAEIKTGTATVAINAAAVTGTGTAFTEELEVGAEIRLGSEIREVLEIDSDTALTVTTIFLAAHTGVALYRINERTWTDDEINGALDDALIELSDVLWSRAPKILDTSATAHLVYGADSVTIPTTLRGIRLVQVLPWAGANYINLDNVPLANKDSRPSWRWPYTTAGATKPYSVPSSYCVVSPTTIELDVLPQASITNGLRFYGPRKLTVFTGESDTLASQLPDPDSFDSVIEDLAVADMCARDELIPAARAERFSQAANNRLARAIEQWSVGRDMGPRSIRLVST